MVLMPIVSCVSEDDIRAEFTGHTFEGFLYLRELRWKVSIPKFVHAHRFDGRGSQKLFRSSYCFALAVSGGTPDNPAEFGSRPSSRQCQERSATADLDIIGMGTQAEDSEPLPSSDVESQEALLHLANPLWLGAVGSPQ